MVCVVRYSFILISICLKMADTMMQVTPLIGAAGNNIIIQCATDKTPQDGVYMYKHEERENKQLILYYYKDGTITPKEKYKYRKLHVDGKIPKLNITFSNVNATDIGLYWCEFNYEEKTTVGTVTWLWINTDIEKKIEDKGEEKGKGENNEVKCPEDPHVKIILFVCAFLSLLCIIGFIFVILKVKGHKKYTPSKQPSDSIYEEMKRSNSDGPTVVRTFINPDYQSTKLLS